MAHFAEIDENNVVKQVIVAEQEFIDSGIVGDPKNWIKTSYNTRAGIHWDPATGLPSSDQTLALRKNFAGPDFVYDKDRDAFISPKPYPSWLLDEESCTWKPPVPIPEDHMIGKKYTWDEENTQWIFRPR
jgi:hypothetical protein